MKDDIQYLYAKQGRKYKRICPILSIEDYGKEKR
jgi:hypothetical protein